MAGATLERGGYVLVFLTRFLFSAFAQPQGNRTLLYVGIGAGVGVLAIAAVQSVSKSTDATAFEAPTRRRLQTTYGYLAASLAGTGVMAGVLFRR